jgi:hypothetical protein
MDRLINGSAKLSRWSLDFCIIIRVQNEKTEIFGLAFVGDRTD